MVEVANENQIVTFFSMYAPQWGCDTEKKRICSTMIGIWKCETKRKMCCFG